MAGRIGLNIRNLGATPVTTYVAGLESISPATGSFGTPLTITGSGFKAGAAVTIDGQACGAIVVVSSTTITCTAPALASGTYDVVVTNAGQADSTPLYGAYTAVAALTLGAMTHAQGGDGTTFACTTAGSNRYLIVLVTSYVGADGIPSGITYNGVAMTLLDSASTVNTACSAWGLVDPASGAHNVVVSGALLSAVSQTSAWPFENVTAIGTPVLDNGALSSPSVTVVSVAGEIIVAHTANFGGTGVTPSVSFTELYNNGFGVSMGTQDGADTVVSWTGADTWTAVAVPVQ